MGSPGRTYGTGGVHVTGGGEDWANASNVSGATNADYATSIVAFPASSSDELATSLAAVDIPTSLSSFLLGCRISTDVNPVAQAYSVIVSLHNSAATHLCDATFNTGVSTSPADLQGTITLRGGNTLANVQSAIEAGVTAGAGPKGLTVSVSNLDGTPVEFRLESVWYVATYTDVGGPGGGSVPEEVFHLWQED